MNNLNKIIKENRDEFDHLEPAEGHFERFGRKLYSSKIYKKTRIPNYIKVAAVLILVSISSIILYDQISKLFIQPEPFTLSDVSSEYKEVEQYYLSMINSRFSEIKQLSAPEPDQQDVLQKELKDMDRFFNNLQKDLQVNPKDERIINAMISHYQLKLEVMNLLVMQLKEIQQINSNYKNYENKEI